MRNLIIFLFLIIFASSCSVPLNFQLSKIGAEPEEYKQRIVYSLPETVLRIDIEIEKETYIPGPYKLYAKRFLGLDNVIQDFSFQYKINSVDLKSFSEADPELFFSVNVIKGSMQWDKYLSLTKHGFIFQPGQSDFLPIVSEKGIMDNSSTSFHELSMKTNLTEVKDTLYKTIVSDTMLIRLPVVTTSQQVRTLEQKAMEAAKNLFLIRENRFYTITNIDGDYPDGKAMEIMVSEMDKMEKAYFELFAGRVVRQKFTRSFIYTPDPSNENQTYRLCSFSATKGLSDKKEGYDINLELIPMNNVPLISDSILSLEPSEMTVNKLVYRIPDMAKVRINLMDEVLYENRIGIYQFGSILDIPVY
ncbi:MAG: DUF4831 family protein [Bacteroidales bacterium]|nr:DUF4831 family protein [Bacteroidales bacterium]MCF8391719.1 DUF4831 family protein [Bacteroidales bacterium]